METNRDRLLALIRERAYTRGEVTLSSGQKSDFYIDGKRIEVSPEGAYLIGEVLFEEIEKLDVNSFGGLAVGAVPLVTSLAVSCYHHGRRIEGFFVRAEAKAHGTMKVIEGVLPKNARVAILEDVVTSGKSAVKAIEAVQSQGGRVVAVVSLVDREAGGRQFFADQGIEYRPVFTKRDVIGPA